jgi:hypothetical protein
VGVLLGLEYPSINTKYSIMTQIYVAMVLATRLCLYEFSKTLSSNQERRTDECFMHLNNSNVTRAPQPRKTGQPMRKPLGKLMGKPMGILVGISGLLLRVKRKYNYPPRTMHPIMRPISLILRGERLEMSMKQYSPLRLKIPRCRGCGFLVTSNVSLPERFKW